MSNSSHTFLYKECQKGYALITTSGTEHIDYYFLNGGHAAPPIYENYDLFDEKTGYHCAKWLVEYCMDNNAPLPKWNIHSANPVGKENIKMLLENYGSSIL